MKIKIDAKNSILLIIFSIFIFGYTIRVSTIPSLQYISILFIIGLIGYLYCNRKNISIKNLIIVLVFMSSTLISDFINEVSVNQWILYFFMNTLSLFILIVNEDKIKMNSLNIKLLIKKFNLFIFIIFGIYLFDLFTSSMIMKFLSGKFIHSISMWVPQDTPLFNSRYASYIGHYLYTDFVYLSFYSINTLYNKYFEDYSIKSFYLNIISIVGVISTGSKTGLLVLFLLIIIFNGKKVKTILVMIIGVFGLYVLGFFNIVLNRVQTENFSTGRFESWKHILELNVLKINIFHGIGDDFFSYINQFVDFGTSGIITEFPVFCMLFKVGVIGFCCYMLILLIIPICKLIKKKSIYGALVLALLFFVMGSYNGLLAYPDTQILYELVIVFTFLIINSSKQI
ncbi:hypothetical protein [Clostridium perfringens]|uniref:hypothetical protein n=1 Tax=Clostridium perfringens TaxID=1502 RepID=UPI0037EFD752|nr:hypothetical protein [Clostridium perfringens]